MARKAKTAGQTSADYAEAKARAVELEAATRQTSAALKALSGGGPMGLTPDAVKATSEWKDAKHAYDVAFAALRTFNTIYLRRFGREIAQDRRSKVA